MRIVVGLLTALMLSNARAGDLASLEFWGFSQQGRFLAFEQYGFQDGSGFPFSKLTVVEVSQNRFRGYAETTLNTEGQDVTFDVVREPTRRKLAGTLERTGIRRGLTGTLVFQKGPVLEQDFDYSVTPTSADLPKAAKFTLDGKVYTLELKERPAPPVTGDCREYSPFPAALLELKLSSGAVSRALQKDISLPNSRKCVYSYGIARIYRYRSSVAVFLRTLSPGFEGPSLGWMVVTGKL